MKAREDFQRALMNCFMALSLLLLPVSCARSLITALILAMLFRTCSALLLAQPAQDCFSLTIPLVECDSLPFIGHVKSASETEKPISGNWDKIRGRHSKPLVS